jgi:hypothetical protein
VSEVPLYVGADDLPGIEHDPLLEGGANTASS